jgi:hypothetical protein
MMWSLIKKSNNFAFITNVHLRILIVNIFCSQQVTHLHTSHSHHLGYVDEDTVYTCNHVPEQGTCQGSLNEKKPAYAGNTESVLLLQLTLLKSRDSNWRPPASKQDSHLLTTFLGTLRRSRLETLATSLQSLPKTRTIRIKSIFGDPTYRCLNAIVAHSKTCLLAVSNTNELKNVTTTCDSTGTLVS